MYTSPITDEAGVFVCVGLIAFHKGLFLRDLPKRALLQRKEEPHLFPSADRPAESPPAPPPNEAMTTKTSRAERACSLFDLLSEDELSLITSHVADVYAPHHLTALGSTCQRMRARGGVVQTLHAWFSLA